MRSTKNSELYLKIYFNSGGSMTNYLLNELKGQFFGVFVSL